MPSMCSTGRRSAARWSVLVIEGACLAGLAACAGTGRPRPDLGALYNTAAQSDELQRNPVVVIPGILGSNLVAEGSGQIVWGAFIHGAADADFPDGARLVALPMARDVPLSELRDEVRPDGVLESLDVDVGLARVTAAAPYRGIIATLAAGRYVDRDIALAAAEREAPAARQWAGGAVDYAGAHFTCFQFDYDWRRDISENAIRLDALVRDAASAAQRARGADDPVKVDIVAHSMGGLVARYYLMYGTQPLPADGSLPTLTWAGAEHVSRAILVGTPNAGSVQAVRQLVEGASFSPLAPTYRPAVLGTMPAVYQLMPRPRHGRIIESAESPAIDLYDVATWERFGWGLADADQDGVLRDLLPDVSDPAERRAIAIDHLRKCLARAEQLHAALDVPAQQPVGLELHLVLGDAVPTASVLRVDPETGGVRVVEQAGGDGTVTRASALLDEREGGPWRPHLQSPIDWGDVQFVHAEHIALTTDDAFVDSMLYTLLERPR